MLPRRAAARAGPGGGRCLTRVVALDVGSSSVRAVAYSEEGEAEPGDARVVCESRDADELVDACRAVLAHVGEGDALAISCFWHSLLALGTDNRPLAPLLTWRDPGDPPAELEPTGYHERTGCFVHPSFWPAKIRRLRAEGIEAARYVSFGEYLLLRLTGELRMSVSAASGTGLFDPNLLGWDGETLRLLGVDPSALPPVSDEPVAGVFPALGDGACSNVGVGAVGSSRAAVTIGTSAASRLVAAAEHAPARPGLFLYRLDAQRFCEGGALSDGGNLHAWLLRTLRDLDTAGIAERPAAAHGLVFEPFLGGERSPGWRPDRRGGISGLSFATEAGDIAQAALEAVCYQLANILDRLGRPPGVVVTGGAALANPGWVQILTDVLGREVEVSAVAEGSARGAAMVAFERLGLPVPPAPVARVVDPRLDRTAIHREAMHVSYPG